MFVCNCNAITERDTEEAIQAGARTWDDVHEYHGCEPCCGKCECEIKEMMRMSRRREPETRTPVFAGAAMAPAS